MKLAALHFVLLRLGLKGFSQGTPIAGLTDFGFTEQESTLGNAYLKCWAQLLNPQRGPSYDIPGLLGVGMTEIDGIPTLTVIVEQQPEAGGGEAGAGVDSEAPPT